MDKNGPEIVDIAGEPSSHVQGAALLERVKARLAE